MECEGMMAQRDVRTGFIGLGSQGGAMARRMVEEGYPLTLWARRKESLTPYHDTAATYVDTVEEMGELADHIGICVVDDAGVRDVAERLIPSMRSGSRLVIHSTIHPDTCIDIARTATERDILLVDAPVSGGGQGAASRTLTVMMGGSNEAVAAVRPVLETFAGLMVHLGDVGAGQLAKLVNNALMAAHVALGYEALAIGAAIGLDRPALTELIKVSSGRSFGFDVAARLSAPSEFAHGAKLLAKDVRLLREVLGEQEAFSLLGATSEPFLAEAIALSH
jgi:3-hydroxyisobutyrate dehydrogenase